MMMTRARVGWRGGNCRCGDEYEGEWLNDLPEGEGMCTYANGDAYTGMFAAGMREGEGQILLGNFCEEYLARGVYRGGWKQDRYSGLGSMIDANGDRYDGVWVDGRRQGRGTQRYVANGERYQGIWMRDQRHGRGRHYFSDGTVYDGQWRNNTRDGKGKCVYKSSGRIGVAGTYNGMWKRDKKNGRGVFEFDNGDVYEGQWKDDMRHGNGRSKYHTGEEYTGDWAQDVRKGSGDELMPRASDPEGWAMQSLRISPEEDRPRVPHGGMATIVKDVPQPHTGKAKGELPSLSGQIVDPRGNPVGDVRVQIQPTLNSQYRVLTADDEGKFTLAGLPEGGIYLSLAFFKQGFSTLQTTCKVMPSCGEENIFEATLAPLPDRTTADKVTLCDRFDSSAGITLTDARNNSISIPPDALCYTDGNQYEGQAEVTALPIDASQKNSYSKMPGYEGRDVDSRLCLIHLYGAVYVTITAVPGGDELQIRGGQVMTIKFQSKVPVIPTDPAPSSWSFDTAGGFWTQTTCGTAADGRALAAPEPGAGFEDMPLWGEGSSKGQDLVSWENDAAEKLGGGPLKSKRALTPEPVAEAEPGPDEEAQQDADAEPEPPPPPKTVYEEVVLWDKPRFQATGVVPPRVYMYGPELEALQASGKDVDAAVQELGNKNGEDASLIDAEARMVQHLVAQDDTCAHAALAVPEIVASLQERFGHVDQAAQRLASNPIIVQRSLVAKVQEQAEKAIPFVDVTSAHVMEALNVSQNDAEVALATLVADMSGKEVAQSQLQGILTCLGQWKSKADISAALRAADYSVETAAVALTGITGTSDTTWCRGQPLLIEEYKRAQVATLLGDKIKFCVADKQSIDIALSLSNGNVEQAVSGLAKEWLGQQMVLATKAHIMQSGTIPWADVAPERVKAALQEHGAREPAMAALTEQWSAHQPLYDRTCAALNATGTAKSDAEICAALEEADFDADAAIVALTGSADAPAAGQKAQIIEALQDKYEHLPVDEAAIAEKLAACGGDVGATLEGLAEDIGEAEAVDGDSTWWMKSYRSNKQLRNGARDSAQVRSSCVGCA
jgi:hypothetical protein